MLARIVGSFVVVLLLLAAAAAWFYWPTRMSEIQNNAAALNGKTVTVYGMVTESFSLLGYGAYTLKDDSAEIYVTTNQGAPEKGKKVTVRGTVTKQLMVGDKGYVGLKEDYKYDGFYGY